MPDTTADRCDRCTAATATPWRHPEPEVWYRDTADGHTLTVIRGYGDSHKWSVTAPSGAITGAGYATGLTDSKRAAANSWQETTR